MPVIDLTGRSLHYLYSSWLLNSGQVITDLTYTLLSLQRFMTLQEEQNQADMAQRCQLQQRNPRSRGGRGGRSPNHH